MEEKKGKIMYQRIKAYVEKYHMLEENDRVIVGVSGGADSICLLFVLLRLQREKGFSVMAVHVHHGLRGEMADADCEYVRRVCEKEEVALRIHYEDVGAYAKEHKLSLEEAGRDVRRAVFEQERKKWGGTKIALAHHLNDNAETLLLNLCRGCALRGAGGIAPLEGYYIRPLLTVSRKEIESYLENRGISYCTDETNLEDLYTRNKLRLHVIPYLEAEINEKASRHMSETMERLRGLEAYVEQEAARFAKECVISGKSDKNKVAVSYEKFMRVPEAIRSYVLYELYSRLAGKKKDIEAVHIRLLEELFDKQTGRRIDLPYQIRAGRTYEGIEMWNESLKRREAEEGEAAPEDIVKMRVFQRTEGEVIFPKNPYTKWFDYDIIKNTVKIRHREPGDYITIDKNGGVQKLKQYFINQKVPREERDEVWLAADGQQVMWIIGYRQNQKYQITDKTRRILEIEFCGGKKDGREC